jgi:hypothetical protein
MYPDQAVSRGVKSAMRYSTVKQLEKNLENLNISKAEVHPAVKNAVDFINSFCDKDLQISIPR